MKTRTGNDVMNAEVVSVSTFAACREPVDLLTRHRFSAVPVVDAFQGVVGVVSEVIEPFFLQNSAKVTAAAVNGVVILSGKVDRGSSGDIATSVTRRIPGVVDVISALKFAYDDREALTSGMFFGGA
ncbi:hypothetical protein Aab01nite_54490 [Paractinoplanes abujensis]|uniref:Putative transcriptional regulator n=1 Tax=Paractinoplanes abujensis TaxID=882441 RepID=A0A7W7CUE8_9ACTN|nr:BON domain-containing protein [Actinoplanes abujensis]MBB4693483.1 putative transcriptional regulator [Actinoplanes abujensis]GID21859.1 hypothetical protein Aab01nite_54490 [Actinoplanes abujensis]